LKYLLKKSKLLLKKIPFFIVQEIIPPDKHPWYITKNYRG